MGKGYFLYRDDKTTCGGMIIEGYNDHRRFNRPQACELHKVTCGKHPGVYMIVGGLPEDRIHGRKQAGTLHSSSSCPCRATFLPSIKTDAYWLVSEKSRAEENAPLTAENRLAMVDTTRGIVPVFTKSCTQPAGCTDAGSAEEPADNFGPFVAFVNQSQGCCEHDAGSCSVSAIKQDAQSSSKNADDSPSWGSVAVLGGTRFLPIAVTAGGSTAASTGAGIEAGFLFNPATIAAGVILGSIFYSPKVGEGSDRVPHFMLPEEYWHNEELRRMAATGQMATTRVRFFFRTDDQGKTRVYGVHTGEGTPYEGVRTGEMKWSAENRRFEFSPHPGQEPLITWTPADGPTFPTSTASPIQKIDQPTILVTPVPEHGETTTPPFPVPDPQDINDWILTFPDNPGYAPIYVLLSERLKGMDRPIRSANPEHPPNQKVKEAMNSEKMRKLTKDKNIDCSEIAEKLEEAADGEGNIIEVRPNIPNNLNILENGIVEEDMVYHQVYTDGRYVYDPRLSTNPIPKGDWEQHVRSLNPDGVRISDKLRGLK